MLTLTHDIHKNNLLKIDEYYNVYEIAAFDIETTGFSAETTSLYLIGCAFYSDDKWVVRQWFNDDGKSEADILNAFISFISDYKYLLHYNGDGFDIPYLTKKLSNYNIEFDFASLISVDLYKVIRPFKNILHIDNLKQKTIEHLININRLDKYSGGDLIKIYKDYLASDDDKLKQLLLQHNYEDLEGLMYSLCIMSYQKLKSGEFKVSKMYVRYNNLYFALNLVHAIPVRISLGNSDITITAYNNEATIKANIIDEELKFFFENYSDYYYLPTEDMAIHKSVASFVDRNYRTQAKRSNCYTKRKGYFISQIDAGIVTGYKRTYEDSESFIELSDSFLQDMDMIDRYAKHIIDKML